MFRVGQKVVCIHNTPPKHIRGPYERYPVLGAVYTVSKVGLFHENDPDRLPCILVDEIDRPENAPLWAHRFRPLIERKTDISFAHEILRKVTKQDRVRA